ncbi:HypC/HybG/HupF family hydrogenase formation chaperone [bacterium]|nr:HypC/HybG/HupF family hydrogenase formation chaperone [bacterium]
MCLAIPGQIVEMPQPNKARVQFGETEIMIDVSLVDDARVGDYVIAHCGFAITKLDEQEAKEQLQLWREYAEMMKDEIPR